MLDTYEARLWCTTAIFQIERPHDYPIGASIRVTGQGQGFIVAKYPAPERLLSEARG